MLIKKSIFSVNHGKIAYGIAKILRAVQCTHTSNMPLSPLNSRPVSLGGGVLFLRKWTFSRAFWENVGFFWEKIDLFTYFFERRGTFSCVQRMSGACSSGNFEKYDWKFCIERHYDLIIFRSKFWQSKYVQNCGPFWTLWTKIVDHFGHCITQRIGTSPKFNKFR